MPSPSGVGAGGASPAPVPDPTAPPVPVSRDTLVGVVRDVFDTVLDAHARGEDPPALAPAVERAREVQEHDDAGELDERRLIEALREVAHGAIATIARLTAAQARGGS